MKPYSKSIKAELERPIEVSKQVLIQGIYIF